MRKELQDSNIISKTEVQSSNVTKNQNNNWMFVFQQMTSNNGKIRKIF